MTDDTTKTNYELGFHVHPSIPETEVAQVKESLEQLITSHGGVISFSKLPEKARLSYPVHHERQSYFGYIQFSLMNAEENLPLIEEQIRLNTQIMRHVILRQESDAQKQKALSRAAEQKERQERRMRKKVEAPAPGKKDAKEMDKQLEEIIGNL